MTIDQPNAVLVPEVDFGFDDVDELHPILASLRSQGDHARVKAWGEPAIMLLSEELVSAAFADEQGLPAMLSYEPKTRPALGRTIQCMTGRDHRVNRGLVAPAFRRQLMGGWVRDLLEPVARDLVGAFAADGTADLVSQFTERLPEMAIEGLLGLPKESRERCHLWARELFMYPLAPQRALAASQAFTELLDGLIDDKRAHPGPDLISTLLAAEIDGKALGREEIHAFVRLLFPAGVDTTYLALGNALQALMTHPDQMDRLVSEPELVPWAVEEALRWQPSVAQLDRVAPVDMVWHGIELHEGDRLLLSLAAAGRDPVAHPDPDRFDIGRRDRALAAFGNGPHVCLGAFLARTEMEVGLRVLLDRLPGLRLVDHEDARVRNHLGAGLRGPARLQVAFRASA